MQSVCIQTVHILIYGIYKPTDTDRVNHSISFSLSDMQKNNFFPATWFEQKIFYPKKYVNYYKFNLQQNSVKGQKSDIKFQNVLKNATKKRKIVPLLILPTKRRNILQRFHPR